MRVKETVWGFVNFKRAYSGIELLNCVIHTLFWKSIRSISDRLFFVKCVEVSLLWSKINCLHKAITLRACCGLRISQLVTSDDNIFKTSINSQVDRIFKKGIVYCVRKRRSVENLKRFCVVQSAVLSKYIQHHRDQDRFCKYSEFYLWHSSPPGGSVCMPFLLVVWNY